MDYLERTDKGRCGSKFIQYTLCERDLPYQETANFQAMTNCVFLQLVGSVWNVGKISFFRHFSLVGNKKKRVGHKRMFTTIYYVRSTRDSRQQL